jgi:hypothetical protein
MGMGKKSKLLNSVGRCFGAAHVDRFFFDNSEISVRRSIGGVL